MTQRRAFLTGGTGFLGSHVARALADEGWAVRALVRERVGRPVSLNPGAECVPGDLSGRSNLSGALRGCEVIVHVAGLVKARSLADYREVNLHGTEQLLRAARESAPEAMFLMISSQAAAGPARNGSPLTEVDPARPVSWYGLSKWEGEQAVARDWKGPWIIMRPGVIYGPRDRGLLTLFRAAASGWLPVPAARSRIQIIHVEQAARAIGRAAGRRDLAGRVAFLCNPEPVRIRDLAALLARLPPRPARLVPIPGLFVRLAGEVETLREKVAGRSRAFNADKAREILAGDWLCDGAPLWRDLDLPAPIPLTEGLRSTWEWYRREGWLIL